MSKETVEQVIFELNSLTDDDPERAHGQAEDLLLDYLKSEGHEDVADAFNRAVSRCGFWYALKN